MAWAPLGWKAAWLAEIEKFPAAVLAHHYPEVPNLGDMTALPARIAAGEVEAPDIFCGGTPCQAFSVAGLRKSLDDARGNLSLVFCEIANAIDTARAVRGHAPAIIFWENVPGVLSTKDNAFGCFLAGLAGENDPLEPPGGKWTNAGCVSGPQRTVAWRVLDAQYFGVAQRRRRVFVVASARKGFDPAQVLFEWDGLRRDTAPSREARQTAPTIPARSTAGGGLGTDFDCDGGTICVATGQAGAEIGADMAPTPNCNHEAPIAAYTINFCDTGGSRPDRRDGGLYVTETDTSGALTCAEATTKILQQVTRTSEDGTWRGTPRVPVNFSIMPMNSGKDYKARQTDIAQPLMAGGPVGGNQGGDFILQPVAFDTTQITSAANYSNPKPGDPCHPLASGAHAPAIAFPANLSGTQCASAEDVAPSMGAANPTAVAHGIRTANTSSNGWGIQEECTHTLDCAQGVAVAVALRGREGGATAELGDEVQNCLRASSGGGDKPHVLCETLYNKGFNHGGLYASTQETHAGKILRTLREAVGEEAFAQWGLGILGSLQSPEILRQALHGLSIRPAAFSRSWVVHCALSRSENGSGWLLQSLREAGCERCASQGWEPSEQLAGKLGAYLSELSQPGAQAARLMRDLWFASEGVGLLQQALLAVQEVGRSAGHKGQSVLRGSEGRRAETPEAVPSAGMQCEVSRERVLHQACAAGKARDSREGATEQERSGKGRVGETPFAVRRLTVEECEFLQGFPRGYSKIPWRKKPADQCPDGPRYKALGNSWAVPNVRWIGERIQRHLAGEL